MALFRVAPFWRARRQTGSGGRSSRAQRRAAARTARAEAALARTEQQIHEVADEVRRDLKGRSS